MRPFKLNFPGSLALQLNLMVLLITTLILAGFGWVRYERQARMLQHRLEESLQLTAEQLTHSLNTPLFNYDQNAVRAICNAAMKDQELTAIAITESDNVRFGFQRHPSGRITQYPIFSPKNGGETITLNVPIRYRQEHLGNLKIAKTRRYLQEAIDRALFTSAVEICILDLFLVVPLILFLNIRFARPIRHLTEMSQRLADGELDEKIQVSGPLEISLLARSFARMRDSIQEKLIALRRENQDREQAERDLQISMHSIGEALIVADENNRILRMNPVAESTTGWSAAEATGQPLPNVLCIQDEDMKTDETEPLLQKLHLSPSIISLTGYQLCRRDGNLLPLAGSGAPIRDADETHRGTVWVFRDISEQVRLEEQLHQSRKMDSIGQLAGGIAHDFNNMLAGILGAAELIKSRLPQKPQGKKSTGHFIDVIIQTSERAGQLTERLLAFSRKAKRLNQPVELHVILQDTLTLLSRSIDKRITLTHNLNASATIVNGDATQLQNAFLNLGVNARDAMPEGGEIQIESRNTHLSAGYCQDSPFDISPGPYIQISVRDTGAGITEEIRTHIFEPFFTTKEVGQGTGLGLAAVYGTISDHQGAITVYSEPGQGTEFNLYLPLQKEKQPEEVRNAPPAAQSGTGNILLVDDEEVIRLTAGELLESLGYDVLLAEDGREAIELYRREGHRIDLVLLDMIMPEMNGRDCFRAIRALNPKATVVISSGFSRQEDIQVLLEEGAFGFVKKPYRQHELTSIIQQALQPNLA